MNSTLLHCLFEFRNIKRLLSILYYSNKKIYLKKSAKDLHISINPLIFAPRLRDNASEKEGRKFG